MPQGQVVIGNRPAKEISSTYIKHKATYTLLYRLRTEDEFAGRCILREIVEYLFGSNLRRITTGCLTTYVR